MRNQLLIRQICHILWSMLYFTRRRDKATKNDILKIFSFRKISEKPDKYSIISNQRIVAKKIDNTKRIRQFVHFKVYFNQLFEFWKNI